LASERRFQQNAPKIATFEYILYATIRKGQDFSFDRCSKIVSSTYIHIGFGDVCRVMMAVLGRM